MRVLLVEDDPNKATAIEEFMRSAIPSVQLVAARSYKSGRSAIEGETFDLILMDMSLPTFDVTANDQGGPFLPFAGKELLRQMHRIASKTPVIIVTQFDQFGEGSETLELPELGELLAAQFPNNYRGAVFYSAQSGSWKSRLVEMLGAFK